MRLPAFHPGLHQKRLHHELIAVFFLLIPLVGSRYSAGYAQTCISFQSPPQAKALSTGVCTLSVEACEEINNLTFYADYLSEDGINRKELKVATITRAPYKFLWDVTSLPNQLYKGMSITAEAVREDDTTESIRRDGIFLTHEQVHRPEYKSQYAGRDEIGEVKPLTLLSSQGSAKAHTRVAWNQDELVFLVEVEDRQFYTDLPDKKFDKLGIEILLDPEYSRSAYPSKSTLYFVVPLKGSPFKQQRLASIDNEGNFDISSKNSDVDFPTTIRKEDFKGYSIRFCIPISQFGNKIPRSFGMNIIANVLDDNTEVHKMSWVKDNAQYIYAPFIWGDVALQEKPLFSNPYYLWISSFFIGVLLGAVMALMFSIIRHKKNTLRKFELSEEDKRAYAAIFDIIENNITKKNLTLENVAKKTRITPRRINSLMRKNTNEDFNSYVMKSRVEIAKERLRSSHSSETSIAALCGFRSVEEMEKQFKHFVRATPYRFREKYQVT